MKVGRTGVGDVLGTLRFEEFDMFIASYDIDQVDSIVDAYAIQHLTQIRSSGRVNDGLMAFQSHGFGHPQRSERVHET